MILFKRVGDSFRHIEDREWLLLVLETLGVLIGILLAFELQEWAQRRSETAKHRQLMERLFEETELDISVLREMRDRLNEIVTREQRFAVELGNGQCPPANEWGAAATFNMMPALTAPTSVYQELMGAGGLSSVERKDVRDSLAQFHGDLDWSQQQVTYFREYRYDPIPPRDPRVTVRFDPTKEEPEVTTFDREALCSDRVFKNNVAAAVRAQTVFASYHQGAVEDAISMCIRLGNSLGRACVPAFGGPLKGTDVAWAGKVRAKMREELAKS
jgi:hypothetical protein